MSNIEILTDVNIIEVIFHDLAPITKMVKAICLKNSTTITLLPSCIRVYINGEDFMDVALENAVGICGIDTVDGIEPTDLDDLYDKLKALIS